MAPLLRVAAAARYFERLRIVLGSGNTGTEIRFMQRNVTLNLRTHCAQDVLALLGKPSSTTRQLGSERSSSSDNWLSHSKRAEDSNQQQDKQLKAAVPQRYAFNYLELGFDVVLHAVSHRILKLVLHCNSPCDANFSRYARCNFAIYKNQASAPLLDEKQQHHQPQQHEKQQHSGFLGEGSSGGGGGLSITADYFASKQTSLNKQGVSSSSSSSQKKNAERKEEQRKEDEDDDEREDAANTPCTDRAAVTFQSTASDVERVLGAATDSELPPVYHHWAVGPSAVTQLLTYAAGPLICETFQNASRNLCSVTLLAHH
jgi:hypothetical protein